MSSLEATSSRLHSTSVRFTVIRRRRRTPLRRRSQSEKVKIGIYLTLPNSILNLINLDLTKPLDLKQIAARRRMHRSDRVVAICLELRNVNCTDAVRLNRIDVDDEAVLDAMGQPSVRSLQRGYSRRCSSRRLRLMMVPYRAIARLLGVSEVTGREPGYWA
jgi:hypothetical protein